jgi:hypothetical protein
MAAVLEIHLSGGTTNTNPNASLGGARSTQAGGVVPTAATANSLFDDVSGAEETAGDTEYRGLYIRNTGNVDAQNVVIWIQSNTADADTQIAMALAGEGVNVTIETIANENTAPSGETFTEPSTEGGGLSMGTIPANQHYGFWLRRTVNAGAGSSNDAFTIAAAFDTAP